VCIIKSNPPLPVPEKATVFLVAHNPEPASQSKVRLDRMRFSVFCQEVSAVSSQQSVRRTGI
jgi:hypothetical protein